MNDFKYKTKCNNRDCYTNCLFSCILLPKSDILTSETEKKDLYHAKYIEWWFGLPKDNKEAYMWIQHM